MPQTLIRMKRIINYKRSMCQTCIKRVLTARIPMPTSIMMILLLFCCCFTYLARLVYETLVATSESAFIFETSIFVPRSIVLSKFSIMESRSPRSSSFNWSVWSLNPTGLLSKNSCRKESISFLLILRDLPFSPLTCQKRSKVSIAEHFKSPAMCSSSVSSSLSLEGKQTLIFFCIAYRSCKALRFHPH